MFFFKKLIEKSELDFDILAKALEFYEEEIEKAKKDVKITNSLEKNAIELPGSIEYRFSQLQDISSIVEFIERRLNKLKTEKLKYYLENYNRSLTIREAEKYAEGEDDVLALYDLLNTFNYIKGRYTAIIKALDIKAYQITNLVKLKSMNIDI